MLVSEILGLVDFIVDKEVSGEALTPARYNLLLEDANTVLFNEYHRQYEQFRFTEQLAHVLAQSPLGVFLTATTMTLNSSTGLAPLPTGWIELTSVIINETGLPVEIVTSMEAMYRRSSVMTVSANLRPYGYIVGTNLQVIPYNADAQARPITLNTAYLPLPTQPVYDYCQSAVSLKEVFMPASSTLVYESGQFNLYQGSTLLTSNVTKAEASALTDPAYTSLTVELQWREDVHPQFISRILSKLAVNLSEPEIAQYAELLKKGGE